jgi:hypothetical protein
MDQKKILYTTSGNLNYSQIQGNANKKNIYDNEFIALINGLNESIKEYYKVSNHNISETNNLISFYEENNKSLEILLNEIINTNQFNRLNEFISQINNINEIMNQLQMNSNSSQKNLDLFFGDAIILFQKMKMKRKEKLLMKNYSERNLDKQNEFNIRESGRINTNINGSLNDINNMRPFNNAYLKIINSLNKLSDFNYLINGEDINMSNNFINAINSIKKELEFLMNLIKNNLDQNLDNYSNSLTTRSKSSSRTLKKEIEILKKKNMYNEKRNKELINQVKLYKNNTTLRENPSGTDTDSKNLDNSSNLKLNNNMKLQIMKLEKLIKEKDIIINSLKNNQNKMLINLINQKDSKIIGLEKELNVYQKNENFLSAQIPDLNSKFQMKINQYENQISLLNNKNISLNRIILNKNKEIAKLQNENNGLKQLSSHNSSNIKVQKREENSLNEYAYQDKIKELQNEIEQYKNMMIQYENQIKKLTNNGMNNQINNNNNNFLQNNKENEDIEKLKNMIGIYEQQLNAMKEKYNTIYKYSEGQKITINQLNREIMNYKRKEKQSEETIIKYIKQIEEMNNNILNTNRIIEQKDELIKSLNERKEIQINKIQNPINNQINTGINNKEIYELRLENQNLKNQIEELKLNKNNYLDPNNNKMILKNKIINGDNLKELQELNIKLMEENNSIQFQNKELLEKNKELTLQNNNLQLSLNSQKEEYSKLEKEIKKKDEELEGLRAVIFKLNSQLEMKDDIVVQLKKKNAFGPEALSQDYRKSNLIQQKNSNLINKTNENQNEGYIKNIINQLNDAEKKISILQNKNRELQFKLDEKQVQKEMSGYRTEDNNISNYEEEFDLKKMVNGARDKIRSEDINIDYPGVQGIKDKYRELLQNMNMLEEQIKILICNINCNNNKIKPQIRQICQLMRIPAKKIELIIAGKDKKKALGILD